MRSALGVQAVGRVVEVSGPLASASDAAEDARRVGAGFVATSGHYGVQGHCYDDQISGTPRTVVEPRAVSFGLRHLHSNGFGVGVPVDVRTDSLSTLSFLEDWPNGGSGAGAGGLDSGAGHREHQRSRVEAASPKQHPRHCYGPGPGS